MKNKQHSRRILILIFSVVFIFSTVMVLRIIIQSYLEQKAFSNLASKVTVQTDTRVYNAPLDEEEKINQLYAHLKEENQDFYGWIKIEGTTIDYPVMYTPDDPEYCLRRAFDKSSSQSGVPFLDARCFENCGNYLIYGHNMSNGTMFTPLLSYAEKEFCKKHPVIQFDTMTETRNYFVVAAFYSQIYTENETGFCYYNFAQLREPDDYMTYEEQIKTVALYDTGETIKYGDQLLTLSTCSYHTDNGRFVVVAKSSE